MASATIPQPAPSPRRPSTRSDGFDHDRAASLTPTRQPPTIRIDLVRAKIDDGRDRETGQIQAQAPWHLDTRLCEAGVLPNSVSRPGSRNNTDDSTVLSKEHSITSSREEDFDSSSDGYSAVSSRHYFSVPPLHPPPPPGNPRYFPPPPWHPPAGHVGGRPPIRNAEDVESWYSRSESGSESEDSDGATNPGQGARRDELRQDIEAKQWRISQLRHEMARRRKGLRELRHRKDNVDNLFMQIFRPHLTSKSNLAVIPMDVLEKRLGEMQAVRDEYYTAESAYEAMELELDTEELVLEKLEVDLARLPAGRVRAGPPVQIPPPPPTMKAPGIVVAEEQERSRSGEDNSAPPPPPFALLGISGGLHDDIHPLYEELLEAAGERQLAKEHVDDLNMHREKILYDLEIELHRKRVREDQGNQISEEALLSLRTSLAKVPTTAAEFHARFDITITDDELDFLRSYEPTSRLALAELTSTTETLAHLRTLCLQKHIMRKHASYHEELAIFSSSPGWTPSPQDGNMTIEPPPAPNRTPSAAASLAHPRFPILLSNPSHLLRLQTPLQALQHALQLPKDDPTGALRRAECMKELGISTLMAKAASTADYINQWLIHRLRTSPLEAELMLAVCETEVRVVNLRRWQEEVLYYWRLDEAAVGGRFGTAGAGGAGGGGGGAGGGGGGARGGGSELDALGLGYGYGGEGMGMESVAGGRENSVIEAEGRVKSEDGEGGGASPVVERRRTRSVGSLA